MARNCEPTSRPGYDRSVASCHTVPLATATMLFTSVAAIAQTLSPPPATAEPPARPRATTQFAPTPTPPEEDARDGVVLDEAVRSVLVLRSGELIRSAPDANSRQRGAAARNAHLPALEAALGPGCRTRWVRVERAAWICLDETRVSGDPADTSAQPTLPAGEIVPFQYAFAAYAGVPAFRRLEDIENDDRAEELERGMGVAIDGSTRWNGHTYVRTVAGHWIAMSDLNWARPSTREGVHYDAAESVADIGFTTRRVATFATADAAAGARGATASGFLLARDAVHLRERAELRHRRVVRTDQGWVSAAVIRVPDVTVPPTATRADERWVDVDVRKQILVAFEGVRPVYATVVSSGRSGHLTARGEFRVWIKLATQTMSNTGSAQVDTIASVYSVERVPWVMFFHDDQALHGAYWHDQFGTARSHGCVNLAPRDARWIFDWAPPRMPAGWEAVSPTVEDPGLLVRVH